MAESMTIESTGPAMAKSVLQASIRVSEFPRVRFFKRDAAANGKVSYTDVTHQVVRLVLEDLEDNSGTCAILRYDAQGALVWRTTHPSLQEAKWNAEFEYGLPEEKWTEVGK
jgi:hypothetical protein